MIHFTQFENKCVLVVKDYFTEWLEEYTILNQEAKLVADVFFNEWVTRFGVQMEFRCDNEWNLESALSKGCNRN